jgi:hypothetical protein
VNELAQGLKPQDITLLNIKQRLGDKRDLFLPLLNGNEAQDLGFILKHINI